MSFSCFQIFTLSEPCLPVRTSLSCREPLFVSDYQVCDLQACLDFEIIELKQQFCGNTHTHTHKPSTVPSEGNYLLD